MRGSNNSVVIVATVIVSDSLLQHHKTRASAVGGTVENRNILGDRQETLCRLEEELKL